MYLPGGRWRAGGGEGGEGGPEVEKCVHDAALERQPQPAGLDGETVERLRVRREGGDEEPLRERRVRRGPPGLPREVLHRGAPADGAQAAGVGGRGVAWRGGLSRVVGMREVGVVVGIRAMFLCMIRCPLFHFHIPNNVHTPTLRMLAPLKKRVPPSLKNRPRRRHGRGPLLTTMG